MCVWRVCALGAVLLLLHCSISTGSELTPEEVRNRIRYNYDIHLVIRAIKANSTLFLNHHIDSYNTTLLMYSAYYGKHGIVEELINQGADVNAQNTRSETALTQASRGGSVFHYHTVELLLNAGANVSLPEAPAESALHYAAYYGRIDIAKALISANADINRQDSSGHTPLMEAVQQRKYGSHLLQAGANPDIQSFHGGNTALTAAIRNLYMYNNNFGDHVVFQQLLDAGANVELPPAPQWGPLHYAAERGLHYTIEKLMEAGANVSRVDSSGKTPLLVAATESEVVEVLLDGGSNVDHQDDDGNTALLLTITDYYSIKNFAALMRANASVELPRGSVHGPLHEACYRGRLFAVKSLIEAGADIERLDSRGRTPLLVAAERASSSLKLLLEAGANVNHQDDNGDTALSLLVEDTYSSSYLHRYPLIQSLLDAGANVSLPAEPAWSPLHWAVQRGLSYVVESLIKSGADVNRIDSQGKTPLIVACATPFVRTTGCVQMLIDAGADVDIQDAEGGTALFRCMEEAYHGSHFLEELVSLFNASASVHLPPFPANSPLHEAASHGLTYYVKRLISAGADINRTNSQGMTPLLEAANQNQLVVKELIEAGSDVNHLANDGETALIKACKYYPSSRLADRDIVVDYLLAAGADPNRNSSTTQTALHWAVQRSGPYVAKRLIMHGASVTAVDGNGYTPLMYVTSATNTLRPKLIEILVAYGSNMDHLSYTQGTLLHRLISYRKDNVALKTAMRFCPNLSLTNDEGSTPMDVAETYNYQDSIAVLSGNYSSFCINDNELYNEGEHRCDTNGAYVCLHDCSWTMVNPSTVGCSIVLFVPSNQDNNVQQTGATYPDPATTSEGITFSTYLPHYMTTTTTDIYTSAIVDGPSGSSYESTESSTDSSYVSDPVTTEPSATSSDTLYPTTMYMMAAHRIKKREDSAMTRESPSPIVEESLVRQVTEESTTIQCDVTCIKEDEDGNQVCGADGITYAGDCELARESCGQLYFSKAHDGACSTENCDTRSCSGEAYDPVCGSDGQKYDNNCILDAIRDCNFPSLTAVSRGGACDGHGSDLEGTTLIVATPGGKRSEDDPEILVNVDVKVEVH